MKKVWNSFSLRILGTVILGMIVATVIIGSIIIHISEGIFIDTYGKAQDKVFTQVEDNLNKYYENLSAVMEELNTSRGFHYIFYEALTEEETHSIKHFNALYQLQKDMETAITKHMPEQNLLIVGENGKTFMNYHSESLAVPVEEILKDDITRLAAANPETLQFRYRQGGFSQSTGDLDVVIAVKAFTKKEETKPYAYVYVTLTESELKSYYNFFVTDTNDFYLVDESRRIICTNQKGKRGNAMAEKWLEQTGNEPMQVYQDREKSLTVFYRNLPYFHFSMYGVINNKKALGQLYETRQIVLSCILIVLIVVVIIVWIVKRSVRPLQIMAEKMQKIKNGDFNEYMEPKGSNEIVELANTYNYMLDDLKRYVDALMQSQRERRKAEIHALQMQINPHYVYNTLASIKWLIFQGDTEKSAKTIDAFIYLLRNTISDTKEFITVIQEVENLKNYVWIQTTRYGEQIKTAFYVLQECELDMLPKMILQPFVENAFFHGFPSGKQGKIQVYFKEDDTHLIISIQDDGIGMSEDEIQAIDEKEHEKFSGIGVKNIKERLQLLYGEAAEMQIQSAKGEGTTVTIRIPIVKG